MAKVGEKLFLSYAWADGQQFVLRLYNDLKARGYEPWMDSENMPNRGRTLPREIIAELNRCDYSGASLTTRSLAATSQAI